MDNKTDAKTPATKPAAKKPAAKKPNTKKSIIGTVNTFKTGFIEQSELAEHHRAERKKQNPEIKADAARKEQLGVAGMQAQTHSKYNAVLASLSNPAIKLFNEELKVDPALMMQPPKVGFAAYSKGYVAIMLEMVGNDKSPENVDTRSIAAGLLKLTGSRAGAGAGVTFNRCLINAIKEKGKSITYLYWVANQNGRTQGNYLFNIVDRLGIAEKIGSGDAKSLHFKMDHPFVKKLFAVAQKHGK